MRDALMAAWAAQLAESASSGGSVPASHAVATPEPTPEVVEATNLASQNRQADAFATGEQLELEGDAARLFRGRYHARRNPTASDGSHVVNFRASEIGAATRKVTAKRGTGGGGLGGRSHGGARLDARRPDLMSDLPHAGGFIRPSSGARLLGSQQTTLHRPAGSVVIG